MRYIFSAVLKSSKVVLEIALICFLHKIVHDFFYQTIQESHFYDVLRIFLSFETKFWEDLATFFWRHFFRHHVNSLGVLKKFVPLFQHMIRYRYIPFTWGKPKFQVWEWWLCGCSILLIDWKFDWIIIRDGRAFLWTFVPACPCSSNFPSHSAFPRSCTTLFSRSQALSRSYFTFGSYSSAVPP